MAAGLMYVDRDRNGCSQTSTNRGGGEALILQFVTGVVGFGLET